MDCEALHMLCLPQFWRMAVLCALSLLHSYLLMFLHGRASAPQRRGPRPAEGRRPICVITGVMSRLGILVAAALMREGYHIVLGESLVCLTVLILVSIPSSRMIQTNYIGPFMLTNILLPLLKNSWVPSRVVNLTSFTHRCVSDIDVCEDALRGMKFGPCSVGESYPLSSTYEYTKLCMQMFSYELHRLLHISSGVSVIVAYPSVVETKIMRELPRCLSWFAFLALRSLKLLQEPDTGVGAVLDAALALPEESGKYFFGGKGRTIRSSRLSYDTEVAKKLWAESSAVFNELQLRGGSFGDS